MIKSSQSFSYKRLNHSKYHRADFLQREKEKLYSLENMEESAENLILISTSYTSMEEIPESILTRTKLLIHPNSGHDNFSAQFVKKANFPIITGNSIRAHAVANYILSAFFEFYAPIPKSNHWDINRNYKRKLACSTKLLIIGHGRIGKLIEKSLIHLVDHITIFDPYKYKEYKKDQSDHLSSAQKLCELPLEQYDTIIMAASLNPSSYRLIDKTVIQRLPSNYLLINAARGQLVDQNYLISDLKAKPKAFAYLDVFEKEPFNDNRESWPSNCSRTSHIAGVFDQLDDKIIQFEYELVQSFTEDFQASLNKYHDVMLNNKLEGHFLL